MKQLFTTIASFFSILYLIVVVFFEIKDPRYQTSFKVYKKAPI
jgi:hypothetical protein